MAVNGIRVSALPEMLAGNLTKDDYLIVNDANTNTKRINYDEFLKSVNSDVKLELDNVVTSVNGLTQVVTLGASDVGAPTIVDFQALQTTTNAAADAAASNLIQIVALNTAVGTVPTGGPDLQTQVTTNANEITSLGNSVGTVPNGSNLQTQVTTNKTDIATLRTDVGTVTGANLQTQVTSLSDTVGDGVVSSSGAAVTHAVAITELRGDLGVRPEGANSAFSLIAQANSILTTHGFDITNIKADILLNTAAIDEIAAGTTDLISPKVNGVAVTATGAELNQLDGVTLGTAASKSEEYFATAAAVAAVQSDVDQNEADADAAIAAVQDDVDQNEIDANAAIDGKVTKSVITEVTGSAAAAGATAESNSIEIENLKATVALLIAALNA